VDPALLRPLASRELSDAFLELAATHGLLGLTLSGLMRAREIHGPLGPTDAELVSLHGDVRRRAAMFELKRDRVLALLDSARVRSLLLKGAALACSVYDEPGQRDMEDLDLLVRPRELKRALRALAEDGYRGPATRQELWAYRRHHFHIPLEHPRSIYVEIHWALTRPHSPVRIDPSAVFEQGRELVLDGGLPRLAPRAEHMILHLVLQNLQEGYSRLARIVDIDRVVATGNGLDWEFLAEEARRGNLGSPLALSLQLARLLLGTSVPDAVMRELRPPATARFHLALLLPAPSLLEQRRPANDSDLRLLELWLVDGSLKRPLLLPRLLVPRLRGRPHRRVQRGVPGRLLVLAKIAARQLYVYAARAVGMASATGRDQMRFWSSHASSSDRL
jgi:hypothetical protein